MTGLIPLLLIWAWSRSGAMPSVPSPPMWPTTASPPPSPPPMPAFQSQPPPLSPTADTGTPLAALHTQAQQPAKTPAPKRKPVPAAAAAARAAATKAARSVKVPLSVKLPGASAQKTAAVVDLQKIVNARGAKLKPDGLYGPKTANAWSSVAKSKGLPPTISRVGPKSARVVAQTFDALSVPPIP